ncbi:MAG: pyridoxal-dependent decarboxylase, partial [Kiloniellales bacterium]|nr:pyridoxal-dependent decarboxylase [Kiloniellales bacterium]
FADWMADYLASVEDYPVRAQVAPGETAARLADGPPAAPEAMERIFDDFQEDILPGVTHWQHPSFFAYFPANSSPPSVLAEMLTAALAVNGMLWETSPAATELETRVMDWLRQMIGLPEGFAGVIHDTASTATLTALLTARERATGWRAGEEGLATLGAEGQGFTVYTSEDSHSSVEKAVTLAGFGRRALRKIATDAAFAMIPEALGEAIAHDRARGLDPTAVVATLGTTGVGAVDPLAPIARICQDERVWLDVDAAWAGSALLLPEHRSMIEGVEAADSFVFNPHKWLFTNFDCSAYFVRDVEALTRTFAIAPAYLQTREGAAVIDYRDWGIPLGRRFRALKLWFVIRAYGVEGLAAMIARHIDWAQELARQVEEIEDFELVAPASLALFNFRYRPPGVESEQALAELNQRLLDRLNDSGRLYLTRNLVKGRFAVRFAVGQTATTRSHVQDAWTQIQETARAMTA